MLNSPLFWILQSTNPILNHLLSLLFGSPPHTYFPVFPWLVYPLIGLAIGLAIKYSYQNLYRDLFIVGGFVFLFEFLMQFTRFHFPDVSFYRTYPDVTLMHLGFAVAWFAMWHFISRKFLDNKFFSLLTFSSKNITLIYFIQWIIIFWCFAFIGYHKLGIVSSIIVSVVMSVATLLLLYPIKRFATR